MAQGWKNFERLSAKILSRWLSDGRCEQVLARQSLMGRMVEKKWGDFAPHPDCPDKWRPLAEWFMQTIQADAKHRKVFSFPGLLSAPKHDFHDWWEKLSMEAVGKNRMMVIVDRSHRPFIHVLALGSREIRWLVDKVGEGFLERLPSLTFGDVTFFQFEKFLKAVHPAEIGCPEPGVKEPQG